jgi:poly(A) polymerase
MSETILPAAEWRDREGLARVVHALGADHMRLVGGAVRDTLLGLPVVDVDIATTWLPEQVIQKLEAAAIKAIPTGIEHGTITAVSSGETYEITTLRHDVETDGRRATIAFASDWRDDAARRDFTINALYADPGTGEIFDYFGGLADLDAGRVIFIGDAATRIAEDNLRILRFYRFAARFGQALDPASHAAAVAARQSLKSLSRERICDELLKILSLPDPHLILGQMAADGIFDVLLPEISDHSAALALLGQLVDNETANMALLPQGMIALRRLAALLPAEAGVAEQLASRLRLSKRQRLHLSAVTANRTNSALTIRQLAYRIGMDAAWDVALLRSSTAASVTATQALSGWEPPVLPLKGGDIVARGLAKGPAVADLLKAVEAQWISEDFPNTDRVIAILDQKAGETND